MSETEKTPVSIKLCILSSSTNICLEVELPHLGFLRVDSCFAAQGSFQADSGTTGLEWRSAACKANTLHAVLLLRSLYWILQVQVS